MSHPSPEDIEASLDGAPAESGRDPVEAHLDECPPCARRARDVEALDALLIDGLLARDPKAGRISPRLHAKLVGIGEREAHKRAALRASSPRTSGRRAAVLPLAARTSGRLAARPGAGARPFAWAAAAAIVAAIAGGFWLSRTGERAPGALDAGADRSVASADRGAAGRARIDGQAGTGARGASGAAARDGGASGANGGVSIADLEARARAAADEASRQDAGRSGREPGAAPAERDPNVLPLEDEPLAPEETGPALAGATPPPAAQPAAPKGEKGVVSASPLKKGPVTRLSIGFEAPLAAFDGAVIPGGGGENGRVLEAKEAKGDALAGVRAGVRKQGLFEVRAGTAIELSYRLYAAAPLTVVCASEAQGRLFAFRVAKPVVGKWTTVTVAAADLRQVGEPDAAPRAGDVMGSIELLAGRPGESVRLLLDDVRVVDKAP